LVYRPKQESCLVDEVMQEAIANIRHPDFLKSLFNIPAWQLSQLLKSMRRSV
jgi:hypothetical protein